MAMKIYDEQNVIAIANAIRSKNGETTQYKPSEMAAAISAIETALEVLPQDTVSGAIANFPDGSNNYPVVELIANIAPKQSGSGDPAPDNVRPISGYTGMNITKQGKNLIPNKTYQRTNNTLRIGTDTLDGRLTLKAGTYTVSIKTSLTGTFSYYDDRTGTTNPITTTATANGRKGTFTLSSDGTYFIHIYVSAGVTAEDVSELQLEVGSSVSDYEPYQAPEVISISWESEAGTVYVGSLNVTTGELTVTHGYLLVNSENISILSKVNDNKYRIYQSDTLAKISESDYTGVYSDKLKQATGTTNDNRIYINSSGDIRMNFSNTYATASALIADIGSIALCFELNTPQTYQLEPEEVKTLLGVNNIYNDTNVDTEVTYRANIDLYIAKKIGG